MDNSLSLFLQNASSILLDASERESVREKLVLMLPGKPAVAYVSIPVSYKDTCAR